MMHVNFFDISVLPNLSLPVPPGSDEISGYLERTNRITEPQTITNYRSYLLFPTRKTYKTTL